MRSSDHKRSWIHFLSVLLVLLWAAPATAAMVRVPVEESVGNSDLVIRGRAADQWCEWSEDGRWIVTMIRVEVLETYGGHTNGDEVLVRVPGGAIDGVGLRVSDQPSFETGEEAVLFLRLPDGGATYSVVDAFQGKNTLREGRVVERDVPEGEFIHLVRALARESLR
jgi:hypothetical protein